MQSACQKGSASPGKAGRGRCSPPSPPQRRRGAARGAWHPGLAARAAAGQPSPRPPALHRPAERRVERPGRGPPSTLALPSAAVFCLCLPCSEEGLSGTQGARRLKSACGLGGRSPGSAMAPGSGLRGLPGCQPPAPHRAPLGQQPPWTPPWHTAFSILPPRLHCCCNSSCLLGEMRFLSQDFDSPHVPRFTNREETPVKIWCDRIFEWAGHIGEADLP